MKGTRTKTASAKSLAGKPAVAAVHKTRKRLCLDDLRIEKMPTDFLDNIPRALK